VSASALILAETVVAEPFLCPEIRLRLITDACRLWRATERDLAAIGLADPYWAFAWPGGQALARLVTDRPELVRGKRVLDFGSGSGIVAIAAAKSGARSVLAADVDPLACAAAVINAAMNGVELETTSADLTEGDAHPRWDVILAGDVAYDREQALRFIVWLRGLAERGVEVLIADPERGFLDRAGLSPIAAYEAPADLDSDGRILKRTLVHRVNPSRSSSTGAP
jgi:predicted nicotinamide N-methyase